MSLLLYSKYLIHSDRIDEVDINNNDLDDGIVSKLINFNNINKFNLSEIYKVFNKLKINSLDKTYTLIIDIINNNTSIYHHLTSKHISKIYQILYIVWTTWYYKMKLD